MWLGCFDPILITYALPSQGIVAVSNVTVETDDVSTPFKSGLTHFRAAPKTAGRKIGLAAFVVPERKFKPAPLSSTASNTSFESRIAELDRTSNGKLTVKMRDASVKSKCWHQRLEFKGLNSLEFLDSPLFDYNNNFVGLIVGRGLANPRLAETSEIKTWLERSARIMLAEPIAVSSEESLIRSCHGATLVNQPPALRCSLVSGN